MQRKTSLAEELLISREYNWSVVFMKWYLAYWSVSSLLPCVEWYVYLNVRQAWWQILQGVLWIPQDAYVYFQKILSEICDSIKYWNLILNTIQCYKFCACYHQTNWYLFQLYCHTSLRQSICYFQNTKFCSYVTYTIFGSSTEEYLLIWVLNPPDIWSTACKN